MTGRSRGTDGRDGGYASDPRRTLDANRLREEGYQHFAICACGGGGGLPRRMREQRGPAAAGNHHYNHQNHGRISRGRTEQQHCCGSGRPVTGVRLS
jgi:hypothetical protein